MNVSSYHDADLLSRVCACWAPSKNAAARCRPPSPSWTFVADPALAVAAMVTAVHAGPAHWYQWRSSLDSECACCGQGWAAGRKNSHSYFVHLKPLRPPRLVHARNAVILAKVPMAQTVDVLRQKFSLARPATTFCTPSSKIAQIIG